MENNLKYNCIVCDFHTNLNANFSRHIKTPKHIHNRTTCPLCDKHLSRMDKYNYHFKKCTEKAINTDSNDLKNLSDQKLIALQEKYIKLQDYAMSLHQEHEASLKEHILTLKGELKERNDNIRRQNEILHDNSININKFVKILEDLHPNPKAIHWDPSLARPYFTTLFATNLLGSHRSSISAKSAPSGDLDTTSIAKQIGDVIVRIYKDPIVANRLLFCLDCSRYTYATTKQFNNVCMWFHDKNATYIIDTIIIPAINDIKAIINMLIDAGPLMDQQKFAIISHYYGRFNYLHDIIVNKILKYISSYFSITPTNKFISDNFPSKSPKPAKHSRKIDNHDYLFFGFENFPIIKKSSSLL